MFIISADMPWECPRGVMVKAMDWDFVLQSPYNVHFWADTLGKGMKTLILSAFG